MAVSGEKFVRVLRKFTKVGLDSSIAIYHLEDIAPYADLTEVAFAAIAAGAPTAVLSTISVTELLVKPFAEERRDLVAACERFVLALPNAAIVPPSYAVAKEAARLRARYGVRTPDALLVATALRERAGAFLTNDVRLRKLAAEGIAVIVLEDYV